MAAPATRVLGFIPTQMIRLVDQYGPESQYAARQSRFEAESERIVTEAAARFQSEDPRLLFNSLVSEFGAKRKEIAIREGTREAELFGKPVGDLDDGCYFHTEMMGVYERANEVALRQLREVLHPLKRTFREFEQRTTKKEETVFGRKFSFEVEILTPETVQKWAQGIHPLAMKRFGDEIRKQDANLTDLKALERFKTANPEDYRTDKMHYFLINLNNLFPSPKFNPEKTQIIEGTAANLKSDYVLVTTRAEIGGKMVATGQWLTWLYRSYNRDPLERLEDLDYRPMVTLLHQDLFLKKMTIDECGKLFDKILKMDRSVSFDELQNRVAEFRYLFANAMPYVRGSASIGEWFERAIYHHFGYRPTYHPNYPKESPDLVALTRLRFSDYLQRYKELVRLDR